MVIEGKSNKILNHLNFLLFYHFSIINALIRASPFQGAKSFGLNPGMANKLYIYNNKTSFSYRQYFVIISNFVEDIFAQEHFKKSACKQKSAEQPATFHRLISTLNAS